MLDGSELALAQSTALINHEEGALVAAGITVVWCAEDRYQPSVVLVGESILSDFMRAYDGGDLVQLAPALGDIRSESYAYTSLGRTASISVLWICPQRLAHQAFLAWLSVALDLTDVIERDIVLGEQTAVDDKVSLQSIACGDSFGGGISSLASS